MVVAESGSGGVVAERLAAGIGEAFAGGVVLGGADGAARLGADFPKDAGPEARARVLAGRVREWHGVRIGVATVFQDDPGSQPPVSVVGLAVAFDGRLESREYRFGGDLPSMKIRTATLALDLLRRCLGGIAA